MKLVIDTNVVISGIFWGGTPNKLLELWLENKVEVFISPSILEEYEKVLRRIDSGLDADEIQEWISIIITNSTLVSPMETLNVIEDDPDDNKFVECGLCGEVDFIISGDKHLLNLMEYKGIQIVSPAHFLKVMKKLI